MQDQTPQTAPAARTVTLDDVREQLQALGLDARKTNASVVQRALGRGGMSTVQRHLDTIRAELDAPAVPASGEIPAGPKDVLDALWRGAWVAAQAQTAQALAQALLERDQARSQLDTSRADVAALDVELTAVQEREQEQAVQARAAVQALAEAKVQMQAHAEVHAEALAAALAQREQERQQWEQERAAAAAAAALAAAEARAAQGALHAELERQMHMLADLRAGLLQRPAAA